MFGEINKKITLLVNLGGTNTGLTTVGYTLKNGDRTTFQARTTAGVFEVGGGCYGVEIASTVFTAFFEGSIEWDIANVFQTLDELFISDRANADTPGTTALLAALVTRTGTAQAGSSNTITLDAAASGLNDFYVGQWIVIASGAGAGQVRLITAYTGSTKVATVHANWKTQPSGTSVFSLASAADIQGVALVDALTTNNDKTGYALTAGEHTAIASDTQTGMTAQGYTTTRAGYLDTLNGLVAAIWGAGTRTLTAIADSPGVVTLLTRISQALGFSTNGWVKVDVEDWKNSIAPANTGDAYARLGPPAGASVSVDIAAVKSDTASILADAVTLLTDANTLLARIPSDIWDEAAAGHTTNGTFGKLMAFLDATVSSRLAASAYTAPDNADIVTTLAGVATLLSEVGTLLSRLPSDVLDEIVAGHNTAGSVGQLLQNLTNLDHASSDLDTEIDALATVLAAAKTELDAIRADYTTGRAANLDHLDAAVSGIAAAVWAVLTSSLTTNGTIGKLLAGYVAPDNTDIVSILTDVQALVTSGVDPWAVPLPGNYANGTAGQLFAVIERAAALIGTGQAIVNSATAADGGTVEIYIGDDYLYADGRPALDIDLANLQLPDLTTATAITWIIDGVGSFTATARSATRVTADLTSAQTAALKKKRHVWALEAVLSGHERTIATGDLIPLAVAAP